MQTNCIEKQKNKVKSPALTEWGYNDKERAIKPKNLI